MIGRRRLAIPLITNATGVVIGLAADRAWGEPPPGVHPVAAFGRAMKGCERVMYADRRLAGVGFTAIGLSAGWAAGGLLSGRPAAASVERQVMAVAVATAVCVAGRALKDAARDVAGPLAAGDLEAGRRGLPALVGRDPQRLDEAEVVRAVVESVAENTADAIVAPALWALVGGPTGALGYRAVNTLDAMVGHRSDRYRRFGWASARTDDIANWAPARFTAALVVMARPASARSVWKTVRRDAPGHPSPNAGVVEAAFAAALGLRLGGTNTYGDRLEVRPGLGDGRGPQQQDIDRAVGLSRDVTWVLATLLVVAVAVARTRA